MLILKKLIFALPFILSVAVFCSQAEIILKDVSILFSFDINLLFQLIFFAMSMTATSYFFIIFATLASDWKIVLPVALLASLSALLFTQPPTSYFLAVGLLITFCVSFALLFNKLTKDPTSFRTSDYIIKPSGRLTGILVLVTSVIVYFSVSASSGQMVQKLIDSVVNLSTEFVKTQQTPQATDATQSSLPSLSSSDIALLKQNPDLLKQYGVDASILDQLDTTNKKTPVTAQSLAIEAAKPMISSQVTNMIQPYLPFVPFVIAFIFFLNFQFFTSITSLLCSPIIYLLFWILEKIGFIHFEVTTREVKKLVV